MSVRSGMLAGVFLLAALVACTPRSPSDTVLAYVRARSADPARTLLLTSSAFQLHHEIPLDAPDETLHPGASGTGAASRPPAEPPADPQGPEAVARAQLAWLLALRAPWYAQAASGQRVMIVREEAQDSGAEVLAKIAPSATPGFDVRFLLSRAGPGAPWRIDAIEPSDVPPASRLAACLVAPSRAAGCFR